MKNKKVIVLFIISILLIVGGMVLNFLVPGSREDKTPVSSPMPSSIPSPMSSPTPVPEATMPPEEDIIEYKRIYRYSCTKGVTELITKNSNVTCMYENKYEFTAYETKILDATMINVYEFSSEGDYNRFLSQSDLTNTLFTRTEQKDTLTIIDSADFYLPPTDESEENFSGDYVSNLEKDGYVCTLLEQ